jgi:hypothetical protein
MLLQEAAAIGESELSPPAQGSPTLPVRRPDGDITMRTMSGLLATAAATIALLAGRALAVGTAFTYQGVLEFNDGLVNGTAAMEFRLYTLASGGSQVGPTITDPAVPIDNGLFMKVLDFGTGVFTGPDRWLQITVNGNLLSPRQQITPSPYSVNSETATTLTLPFTGTASASNALSITNSSTSGGANAILATMSSTSSGSGSAAVRGVNNGTSGDCIKGGGTLRYGVYGSALNCGGIGVYGTTNSGRGVAGFATLGGGIGVYGNAPSYPGYFVGARVRLISPSDGTKIVDLRVDGGAVDLEAPNDNLYLQGAPNIIMQPFSGSVGIGTEAPAFLLHCDGSAGKPGGGSWSSSSDARLKKNVHALEGTLDRLLSLRGVTFEYIDPEAIHELRGTQIGMIAQEVEQVFPGWVEDGRQGWKTVTYRGFEALTVEALRDLRAEKDAEIADLRAENADLRRRLEAIESILIGAGAKSAEAAP